MGLFTSVKDKLSGTGRGGLPPLTEAMVKEALSVVHDPDLHKDIVTLGFVRNIVIKGASVSLEVNLTTPACPVKEQLKSQCETELRKIPGVEDVQVTMTATTRASTAGNATIATNPSLAGVRNIIAVASGKGGVAKSTTAVNLAYALAKTGSKVGLLDADVYGPSIPRMVRITKGASGESQTITPPEADGIKVISVAMFAQGDRASILRGPMAGGIIKQFLTQVQWGELDYLIIDYPPGTGDIQLTISQTAPVTGAVIVTTPQEVSLIDVRKAVDMFKTLKVPVLGVIETMSYFVCDGCDKKHFIFRQGGGERLAREYGVALLGQIPIDPAVAVGGDEGKPLIATHPESVAAQAYVEASGNAARQVSILNAKADGAIENFSLEWKH